MSWTALLSPFSLKEGELYACSFKLSFIEKAMATPELVEDRFTSVGFTNVTVDLGASRAEGTWDKPDENDVELPEEVVMVWLWEEGP